MSANDDKKVPEQKAMTVDNSGYEEAFEDVNRPNVESASEVVKNLQKKLEDVVKERENLRNKGSTRALVTCSSNSRNCPGCLGCQQLSFYYMTYTCVLATLMYYSLLSYHVHLVSLRKVDFSVHSPHVGTLSIGVIIDW